MFYYLNSEYNCEHDHEHDHSVVLLVVHERVLANKNYSPDCTRSQYSKLTRYRLIILDPLNFRRYNLKADALLQRSLKVATTQTTFIFNSI